MSHLISASMKAMQSFLAPGMFYIFVASVCITLVALTVFFLIASSFFLWLGGYLDNDWIGVGGTFGSGLLAWFLFPGIMPIIVNFFDDRIASIIERQDYPSTHASPPPFWPEFWHDARFSLLAVGLNLLALPLYLIPLVNIALFYLLNGYLLGREFFVMAARRHMPIAEAVALRKRNGAVITAAGMLLVVAATIPFINLFAPFWGIAVMTHLYHLIGKSAELLP